VSIGSADEPALYVGLHVQVIVSRWRLNN